MYRYEFAATIHLFQGHSLALTTAAEKGLTIRGPDSLPALFPAWSQVSDRYRAHQRQVKPAVHGTFDVPLQYQHTTRGNISGDNERSEYIVIDTIWVLEPFIAADMNYWRRRLVGQGGRSAG